MPTETAIPPQAATIAPSARLFELTIWCGPIGSPGMTISSPVDRMPTRGRRWTNSHGRFIAASEADVARRQPPAGLQQHVALGEIEALAPHIAAAPRGFEHPHPVAVALGVLLDDDRVGAGRHRRAGEDARRLARADMAAEPGPGRHLGDDAQFDRDLAEIVGAHRIAVHRRDRERRLGAARGDILGEHPAEPVGERDLLGRQGFDQGQQARQRFFDRNHGFASQSPDLPPDLRSRRRSVTTMPRSTALHMS